MEYTIEQTIGHQLLIDTSHPDYKDQFDSEFDGEIEQVIDHCLHYGEDHVVVKQYKWIDYNESTFVEREFSRNSVTK